MTVCGPENPPEPTKIPTPTLAPVVPVYEIGLSEFQFRPDRIELRVGQEVTFHVVNHGAVDHELMIGRNPLRDEAGFLGDGFEHDFFENAMPQVVGDATIMNMGDASMDMEHGMANGWMASFAPENEATITFTVTEDMLGTWLMGCFEIDQGIVHFDEGMIGVLYVPPE